MNALPSPPKPHKNYPELVKLLQSRGMIIPDRNRAQRKLSQIGYYRLSGFWYPCREFEPGNKNRRADNFQKDINFNDIIQLYLFDKKLRLLMMDAIERIETHLRSVIAHEMGYHDPLAYLSNSFINPAKIKFYDRRKKCVRNLFCEWLHRHNKNIYNSREECILHHKNNGKKIPFWVVIETWDFGTMSTYFDNLKWGYQKKISRRIGITDPRALVRCLREINLLRNKCAHHARIWNLSFRNPLPTISDPYFNNLSLNECARKRMYGMICLLWFLIKKIGPSSGWLNDVTNLINSKPKIDSCPFTAMGFSNNTGFPKSLCNPPVKACVTLRPPKKRHRKYRSQRRRLVYKIK